jgi:hypothetical protein
MAEKRTQNEPKTKLPILLKIKDGGKTNPKQTGDNPSTL